MTTPTTPEGAEVTAPTIEGDQRILEYPVIIEVPTAYHFADITPIEDQVRHGVKSVTDMATKALAVQPRVVLLELLGGTDVVPETGEQETCNYLRIGIFFSDVTAQQLRDATEKLQHAAERYDEGFSLAEYPLPRPVVYLPTNEQMREIRDTVIEMSKRSKRYREDASYRAEVAASVVKEGAKRRAEMGGAATTSAGRTTDKTPENEDLDVGADADFLL